MLAQSTSCFCRHVFQRPDHVHPLSSMPHRGSGRIVWRPITRVIVELGLIDEHGKTTAAGLHAPYLAGGRWNRPGIGWGDPVEGQAPIGSTKSPPGVRGSYRASSPTFSSSVSRIASTSGGTLSRRTLFGQSSIGGAASSSFDSVTTRRSSLR